MRFLARLLAAASFAGCAAAAADPQQGSTTGATAYPADWQQRLGDDVWSRFVNYYRLEWGHDGPPPDPTAPPARRAGWPATPQSTPPMPFTEWPYGGSTNLGVTRPNSVDSPLMVAIAKTRLGEWLNDAHIQVYDWINVGGNISTNTTRPGGNWPVAYM